LILAKVIIIKTVG